MKKVLALAAALGTALVVAVSPANTAKIDNLNGGPVCADILQDSGITDYTNNTVTFALRTAAPACRGILYTVNVYDDTSAHNFLGSGSSFGTKEPAADDPSTGIVFVTVPLNSLADPNAQSLCIEATSSGDRVFDRAPDTGTCSSFNTPQSGSSGGSQNFG